VVVIKIELKYVEPNFAALLFHHEYLSNTEPTRSDESWDRSGFYNLVSWLSSVEIVVLITF
jgi:hypothetical protein